MPLLSGLPGAELHWCGTPASASAVWHPGAVSHILGTLGMPKSFFCGTLEKCGDGCCYTRPNRTPTPATLVGLALLMTPKGGPDIGRERVKEVGRHWHGWGKGQGRGGKLA